MTEPLTLPTTIDPETQLETALLEPPLVEYLGINFMKNGSDFTRQALQVSRAALPLHAAAVPRGSFSAEHSMYLPHAQHAMWPQ